MKDKIIEIAEAMVGMTESHDEEDLLTYMTEQAKKHNLNINKVFQAYTGVIATRIMHIFNESEYNYFCISQHKESKAITHGQTFDVDELAEVLSYQIPVQSLLRKALDKANQININDGQYVQFTGGEA